MRNVQIGAIALAAILTVSGCGVFKEYSRPEMPQTDNVFGMECSDTACIAEIGWRDFFTDPMLQQLIEKGLENNADARIAAKKVIEAEASMDAARYAFLPYVGIAPSFNFENADRYNGSVSSYSIQPSASWEADINGKLLNSRRIAEAGLEGSRLYERSVRTELIATIANCYYTLLMLDAQLEVSKTTSDSWKENVRITKAMKDAGMTNEASVAHTEANSCSIEASLFDLEYKVHQMENTMAALLGETPQSFERRRLQDEHLSRDLSIGVPASLLSRRPDVMEAEIELRKAYYNTNIARAAFYPSLTISGDFGWEKPLTSAAGWAFGLAASLSQPIFNKGRNNANLKIAEAKQEEALVAFERAIRTAGSEVNDALAKCKAAEGKTEIRINQIEALEKAVESTQLLMRHAESTYLEVLTAQQSLLSARLQQISDHYDTVQGIIALYKALGGGAE